MKTTQRGFTLIELIVVMAVTGILAGMLVMFFQPAFTNYLASGRRAALTDMADGAMRRVARDIRAAVPNSVRERNSTSLELVPAYTGGRFRFAPDTQTPAMASAELDTNSPGSSFDVLSTLAPAAAAGDWVVIGNQNPAELGNGDTRTKIDSITNLNSRVGTVRITLTGTANVPPGYEGGRFMVVPDAQQAVAYVCTIPTPALDANGTGLGTLFRVSGVPFSKNHVTPATNAAQILATRLEFCSFNYDASSSATMENGYVEITLQLTDRNESVTLYYGVHVDNVP